MNLNIFQRWSLKTKITLFTLVIFLISIWSLAFYASRMLYEDMQRMLGEQQFSTVSFIAAEINEELGNRLRALEKMAGSVTPAMLGNTAALQKHLEERLILQDLFNGGTFVTRIDGGVTASIPLSVERFGVNYLDRDYIAAALKEGKATIGQPVIGRALRVPAFGMAAPIRDSQGKVIGALAGVTYLGAPNFLNKIAENRYGKTGGYLLVAPQSRLVVTATDKSRILETLPAPGVSPLIDRFLQGLEGSAVFVNPFGVEMLASDKGVPVAGWIVSAVLPTAEAFAPIRAMQQRILLATFFFTLLAGTLTWFMLRRQLSPLLSTVKKLAAISETDQTLQILPVTSRDEIGQLIGGFNRLLETLAKRENALMASEATLRSTIDKLSHTEDELQRFFNLIPDLLSIISTEGRFLKINSAWVATLGYSEVEILATPCIDLVHPDDRKATIIEMARQIAGEKTLQFVNRYRCKDGSYKYLEWHAAPAAVTSRVVCSSRDITERKRLEEARNEALSRLQKIASRIPGVVLQFRMRVDGSSCVPYASEAIREVYRVSPEEVRDDATTMFAAVHPDDLPRVLAAIDASANNLTPLHLEYRLKFAGEPDIWLLGNAIPQREADGSVLWHGFITDITERKRDEADLLAAKAEAEKANLAKSRFLAAASHDLRQPLSALSLYVGVLKNRVAPDSKELVSNIQDCVDSFTGLLTDLLDVSKLEAGAVKIRPTDVALDDMIATLVSVLSAEARQQGLRLRARCSGMVVRTDPRLLHRILGNLIVNAIRYTHKGGVLIACRRHKGKRWIEIWDTGIGISENHTTIIFEEFRQLADEARNRGSGLGLAIVAKTAELMGLEIRVRSRPGRGSMFAVELPAEGESPVVTAPPVTLPQLRPLRIGLVEDHPEVLRALALLLKSLGHEVIAVTSGGLLLERLGGLAPDMIISDYRLAEGETGFDVIAAARDIFGKGLPAFLITGETDPEVVRSMAERGIAVLFKPLQVAALQAAIGEATARRAS